MAEFTGERVIPGQVDIDLLNEHLARYAFAARLARGKRVLDAGCGAGYGAAEVAHTAQAVVGMDIAAEAVEFARANYRLPNLCFEQGSCAALPHKDSCFDLVVAFEVIEHLGEWREFLLEVRRVIAPNGQFLVSTPNKRYYNESRGPHGSNPFHVHEFEFEEFRGTLKSIFPHVALYLENHVEGVSFQPYEAGNGVEVRLDAGEPAPDESHFFVAVCGHRAQAGSGTFVYIPRAANVLRERERHIALLEGELETKNAWLEKALKEHEELTQRFRVQKEDLEKSNRWAQSLNAAIGEKQNRIVALQQELADGQADARRMAEGYEAKIGELQQDILARTRWAESLTEEVRKQTAELATAVEALHRTERELEDRTGWALGLQKEAEELGAQIAMVRASRWVRLGRKAGLGPVLPG